MTWNRTTGGASTGIQVAHGCRLYKTAPQPYVTGVPAAATWEGEVFDTDAYHDPAVANTRITIPAGLAGKYVFTCGIDWAANVAGARNAALWRNGAVDAHFNFGLSAAQGEVVATGAIEVAAVAGDFFEVVCSQSSGGGLNVLSGAVGSSFLAALLVGS